MSRSKYRRKSHRCSKIARIVKLCKDELFEEFSTSNVVYAFNEKYRRSVTMNEAANLLARNKEFQKTGGFAKGHNGRSNVTMWRLNEVYINQ